MRPSHSLILLLLATGCADYDVGAEGAEGAAWDTGYQDAAPGGDGGGAGDDGDYAPEEEDSFFALRPASSPTYVFIANPDRDTVTRVTVPGLEVITAAVGARPTVALTSPDYTRAVTFNADADSVSVIDAETMAVSDVAVRDDFSNIAMSPDGRYVIAWFDPANADDVSDDGARSFNEVSVVDTVALTHTPLVVGFNPRDIQFDASGETAVVVSDAYVAVIDLTAEEIEPVRIAVADDLVDPPTAEEVLVDPAGRYAIVRQFGAVDLVLIDLEFASVQRIATGDNPTDLDVTPDGSTAVAVARDSHELWLYDLSDPAAPATVIALPPTELLGSVVMSPDGSRGLLFSTASGAARYASWEVETGEVTLRPLVKPVQALGISPTGETALVFHTRDDGDDVDPDSPFSDRWALTMIDMTDDFFSNPLALDAEPIGFSHSEDGGHGFFVMDGQPWLEVLDYDSLLYDEVALYSDPVHVGTLPGTTTAWASQEHELGRISFYDTATEIVQTITGFELNSGIEH